MSEFCELGEMIWALLWNFNQATVQFCSHLKNIPWNQFTLLEVDFPEFFFFFWQKFRQSILQGGKTLVLCCLQCKSFCEINLLCIVIYKWKIDLTEILSSRIWYSSLHCSYSIFRDIIRSTLFSLGHWLCFVFHL